MSGGIGIGPFVVLNLIISNFIDNSGTEVVSGGIVIEPDEPRSWERNLCEDGYVEAHLGLQISKFLKTPQKVKVVAINVGGATGAWKALEVEVLKEEGWPEGLMEVLKDVWCHQERWIYWVNHVDPDPLMANAATPQGDPWGPFALNVWMAVGHWKVEERERENQPIRKQGPHSEGRLG